MGHKELRQDSLLQSEYRAQWLEESLVTMELLEVTMVTKFWRNELEAVSTT